MRGQREILLKARQFGFSTLILALFFLDTISTPHTSTVVVAHDAESTERLFMMVQRFYESLPDGLRPRTKYANRREYLWPDLDSYFYVGQAGSKDFGRGSTLNNVHMSEVGSWDHADELVSGLLQAVPADGNVFVESTAKGLGNWFHAEYIAAEKGDSAFTPRFFGWHQHEEYQREPEPGFVPTAEERKAQEAYDLSLAQVAWMRDKQRELRRSGTFPQEYPGNPREAFLTSGNPYFDREYLGELSATLESADYDPLDLNVSEEIPAPYALLKRAYRDEELLLWVKPQAGAAYVISADTAEGLTDEGDHDYCAADVFDAETWEQVAHFHGRWEPHEYGLLLTELGRWYNLALLGIERNNHGHAVLNAAKFTAEYPESRDGRSGLYLHEEWDEQKKDKQKKLGWPTTVKTKFFALDTLGTLLDERSLGLNCRQTVSELLTFVKKPGGKAGGEGKCHDDAVTSLSIAAALLKLRPRSKSWAQDTAFLKELRERPGRFSGLLLEGAPEG